MTRFVLMLGFVAVVTTASAQKDSITSMKRTDFSTALEANSYYDIVEKLIEARYTDKRTVILEKMGAPEDSLRSIEERIRGLEEKIIAENAYFIKWEKDHREGKNFAVERERKESETKTRISQITPRLETLKWRRVFYLREIEKHESSLADLNKEQEKEMIQAKADRRSALVQMYRT
jgi:hypothetical protein